MVRKETWILILVLAGLVGLSFVLRNRAEQAVDLSTPTPDSIRIFGAELGTPTSIEILPDAGDAVRLARGQDGVWSMELPRPGPANQGLAEAAATQLVTLRREADVAGEAAIFGLESPAYVVNVSFDSGEARSLAVGDATPTSSGYYARLDLGQLVIVGYSGMEALLNLVSSPPYLETPTAVPDLATPAAGLPPALGSPTP
jgi:hypothetical protein